MKKINLWQLTQRQGLPLEIKEKLTEKRVIDWYNYWNGDVYVSFSGGKDSTVLLHLIRKIFPKVPAVFIDTGLEYPEIRSFIKTVENVTTIKPKIPFTSIIKKYGYPIISKENAQKIEEIRNTKSEKLKNKRLFGDSKNNGKLPKKWGYLLNAPFKISSKCCYFLKKYPFKVFEKETGLKPYIATMADDSFLRKTSYLRSGCNSFNSKRPVSNPISFWMEKDIFAYIEKYNLRISDIYNKGYKNTGCMFCMFGCHLEKQNNKFIQMKATHPKLYSYCINKLELGKCLDYIGVKY